jgi:hypothetical protein
MVRSSARPEEPGYLELFTELWTIHPRGKKSPLRQSDATTVAAYLAELPADRRAALEAVRQAILANLPAGYEEAMSWGMITYQVPLACAELASQKSHMAVYIMGENGAIISEYMPVLPLFWAGGAHMRSAAAAIVEVV